MSAARAAKAGLAAAMAAEFTVLLLRLPLTVFCVTTVILIAAGVARRVSA